MRSVCVVWTTFAEETEAARVAHTLVAEELAACAQLEPIRSWYRWDGRVEEATEFRVTFKTMAETVDALRVRLLELHSYSVPQFVVVEGRASEEYGIWVRTSCGLRP